MPGNSNLVDVELYYHDTPSEKAALLSKDGLRSNGIWFPLSAIEIDPPNAKQGKVIVTMPQWLAEDRGVEDMVA